MLSSQHLLDQGFRDKEVGFVRAEGLVYALPKAQVRLVIKRIKVTAADVVAAKKSADNAAQASDQAQKQVSAAEASVKDLTDSLAAVAAPGKDELVRQQALAQAWLAVLKTRSSAAKTLAAQAKTRHERFEASKDKWHDDVTIAYQPNVPDTTARFIVKPNESLLRDDTLKVAVKDGLLNTVSAAATDQTAAVLINIAGTLSIGRAQVSLRAGADGLVPLGELPPNKGLNDVDGCKAVDAFEVFDPTNETEVKIVAARLSDVFGDALALTTKDTTLLAAKPAQSTASSVPSDPPRHQGGPGFVYRAARLMAVSVHTPKGSNPCKGNYTPAFALASAVVPDSSTTFVLPVRSAAFVRTKVDISFKDGMPTEVMIDSPSQLVAITALPLSIASAIISVPTSLIKLRVDYDSQATALVEARTKLIKAQADLKAAQEALEQPSD